MICPKCGCGELDEHVQVVVSEKRQYENGDIVHTEGHPTDEVGVSEVECLSCHYKWCCHTGLYVERLDSDVVPSDVSVPPWKKDSDTRIVKHESFPFENGESHTCEIVEWRDGSLSVRTRLPGLPVEIDDRTFAEWDGANEEYERRCNVISQLR